MKHQSLMPMKRLATALFLLLAALAAGQAGTPSVEFLQLTDTHVTDLSGIAEPLAVARHHFRNTGDDLALGKSAAVQVRTAVFGYGVNNWRRIRLHPDRIEVFATGKQELVEKTIPIRREGP